MTTTKHIIKYWQTYTRCDARFTFVEAVRIDLDYVPGASVARVPAFGIEVGPASDALLKSLRLIANAVSMRHGYGAVRQGVMTQAMYAEERELLTAAEAEALGLCICHDDLPLITEDLLEGVDRGLTKQEYLAQRGVGMAEAGGGGFYAYEQRGQMRTAA